MRYLMLWMRVIKGAIRGVLAVSLIYVLITALLGLIVGGIFGIFLLPLYYGLYFLLMCVPVGLVIGGVVAGSRIIWERRDQRSLGLILDIGMVSVPIFIFILIAIYPHINMGVQREVTHGARWHFASDITEDRLTRRNECRYETVVLILTEYATYEVVCSRAMLDYLLAGANDVIPITYRVTYDFDDVRSYRLIQVGAIPITRDEWVGGVNGCGGNYLPACNTLPEGYHNDYLHESSWVEED